MKLAPLSTQIWTTLTNGSRCSKVCPPCSTYGRRALRFLGPPRPATSSQTILPVDLDDAELEVYAEECAKRAAIADFEDIPLDELFSWSDTEELKDHDEDFQMMH